MAAPVGSAAATAVTAAVTLPVATKSAFEAITKFGSKEGHQIFVYNHVRTKQIVYSLTKVLSNSRALKQTPFVGKNTVPRALRKDHWTPLCVLSFPNRLQGLSAYRKLREFKLLHEVAYPLEIVTRDNGKRVGHLVSKKEKSRILMNQKANAVADMAAVLAIQGRPPSEEEIKHSDLKVYSRQRKRPNPPNYAALVPGKQIPGFQEKENLVEGARVADAPIADAPIAEVPVAEVPVEKEFEVQEEFEVVKEDRAAQLYLGYKNRLRNWMKTKPKRGRGSQWTSEVNEFRGKLDGVSVWWADEFDAEFAETWPQEVMHGPLLVQRRAPVWPPPAQFLQLLVSDEPAAVKDNYLRNMALGDAAEAEVQDQDSTQVETIKEDSDSDLYKDEEKTNPTLKERVKFWN